MSERVLWLRLCVTGPTPECGEIVGLRIVDRQARRMVFDAFFHPVREDGWKSVPAGGVNVNLANRLPLNIYCFASIFLKQFLHYFSAVWAAGFQQELHHMTAQTRTGTGPPCLYIPET